MDGSNGLNKAYASTNSDRLRSPTMQPGVWRRDNGVLSDTYLSSTDLKGRPTITSADRPYSSSGAPVTDRWRYQPSEYVAMRSSNSAIPSASASSGNYARSGTSSFSSTGFVGQSNFVSPKPTMDSPAHSASSGGEPSSRASLFSPGTASIHRDLDSVLDDIKRELGKSRPDMRLSLSIDGGSTQIGSSSSGSSATTSFAASRDSVAQRIDSLRSRLDSVARHEASTRSSLPPARDQGSSVLSHVESPSTSSFLGSSSALSAARTDTPSLLATTPTSSRSSDMQATSLGQGRDKDKDIAKNSNLNLAEGWEMKLDSPSGRIFYVNHTLKAISWEPPMPPTPPPKTTSKSAALDQLSERTKALGAKLRDEMKLDAKNSAAQMNRGPSPTRTSSGMTSAAAAAASTKPPTGALDAKTDTGSKGGKEAEASGALPSASSSGIGLLSLASGRSADIGRASVSSPRQGEGAGKGRDDAKDAKSVDKTAERLADRIAERLAQEVGAVSKQSSTSTLGLYGSMGERAAARLHPDRPLGLGMGGSERGGTGWHVGTSGDPHGRLGTFWSSNNSLAAGVGGAGADRWGLGASGEAYGLPRHTSEGRQGSFWHGGDRWDHATTSKSTTGATLRSSLDSAKLAMLERNATSPRTVPADDPTLTLLNKASSQLWHHLLNASPSVSRSPEHAPTPSTTTSTDARDLAEFDRWVKNLSQSTPRELDESPVKRPAVNATAPSAVKAQPPPPAPVQLPAGINASMAWQV